MKSTFNAEYWRDFHRQNARFYLGMAKVARKDGDRKTQSAYIKAAAKQRLEAITKPYMEAAQ